LTPGSFSKAVEHEYKFISVAGEGGTNTYSFLIEGMTVVLGLEYGMDGSSRYIGMVGTVDGTGPGVLIDDIDVRLYVAPTYEAWAEAMGLDAGNSGRTLDPDTDGMDNLLEYALTGNPLLDDAAAVSPGFKNLDAENMEYIYRRRNDAGDRGLAYDLQMKDDLVIDATWAITGGALETGTNTADSAFDVVTNTVPKTGDYGAEPYVWDGRLFLKLEIIEN